MGLYRWKPALGAALVCSLSALAPAAAEVVPGSPDVPPVSGAPMGFHSVRRGVQGPAGMLHSRVLLHVNASKDSFGEPVSLAPDLYYAATDNLQIGLLHNLPMGLSTQPPAGICLSGAEAGCSYRYRNVGADLMYGLAFGDLHFSLHGSLFALRPSDPLWLAAFGVTAKVHFNDDVALFFDPQIGLGLGDKAFENRDQVFIPVELQFQLSPPVAFKVLSGVTGNLDGFGDTYQVPFGFALIGNVSEHLDLGFRFNFDNLLGKRPPGVEAADQRSLALLMHIRF